MKANMMKAYLTVMNKIAAIKDNEDGMETVQAIILIVVGLIIVGALVALAKNKVLPAIESSVDSILKS